MKFKRKMRHTLWLIPIVLFCVVGFGVWQVRVRAARHDLGPNSVDQSKSGANITRAAKLQHASDNSPANLTTSWPVPQLRPLPVVRRSQYFEWTAGDAMDTNVLRQIAHNQLEYQRLVEESARIIRRQLVYRNETIDALIQRARAIGAPVKQLIVPGLDGQEFVAELTEADLHPSGLEGAFVGQLVDQPDSMVTVAFKLGREAFAVIAPSLGLYLQGDPREPGEIIVKSIDPATYVPGVCGTP